MRSLSAPLLAALLLSAGCTHVAPDYRGLLATTPPGRGFVSGKLAGAEVAHTLDRADFTYDLVVDASSRRAAFVHLAPKVFSVGLVQGEPDLASTAPAQPLGKIDIGLNEFDVEALALSPDGTRIASISHEHRIRLHELPGGKLLAEAHTEGKPSALAWSPDGRTLVLGTQQGLLQAFDATTLDFLGERRAHGSERVSALVFGADGLLWSGGWDKALRAHRLERSSAPVDEARLGTSLAAGLTTFEGQLEGRWLVFAIDGRQSMPVLSQAAAQRAGIDPSFLADKAALAGPNGVTQVPLAVNRTLRFEALETAGQSLAICAACVPEGVDVLLGASFAESIESARDGLTGEVVLTRKAKGSGTPREGATFAPVHHFPQPGFVQDVATDRLGKRVAVALGELKAERTLAIYDREKAGKADDKRDGDLAAVLDAESGAVLFTRAPHQGFVGTVALSPDGKALATGGWDYRLFLFTEGQTEPVYERKYGWIVKRLRFSPDGRLLAVAAWTPQNANGRDSDPSAELLRLIWSDAAAVAP